MAWFKAPPAAREWRDFQPNSELPVPLFEHGLVLVEGYFDVLRLWQYGICHAVALMGSTLSEVQEAQLVEAVGSQGRITLLFDGDPSGRACTQDALERLSRRVFVKAILLPDGMQPDHLHEEDIRAFCS